MKTIKEIIEDFDAARLWSHYDEKIRRFKLATELGLPPNATDTQMMEAAGRLLDSMSDEEYKNLMGYDRKKD
jgi:hypothetical protein